MKKMSLLAAAITVALTGCGSDDSGAVTAPTTTTNKFIDAAVEGMYYSTSSGLNGTTDSEGQFTSGVSDTVTFYIGGENGLKVGAASNRDVLTPFEAAGKYARALNLAILLQSLDNQFGSMSDEVLTIPDVLRAPDAATLAKMKDLSLDDRTSVENFLTDMGVTNITSEDDALAHMNAAFGSMERGDNSANPFADKNGKFVRYIDVTQERLDGGFTFVHADKTLPSDLFEATRGMVQMDYQVNSASLTSLIGSNDSQLSEDNAEDYLNCLAGDPGNTFTAPSTCIGTPATHYTLGGNFKYLLVNPDGATTADESMDWANVANFLPFSATTVNELNHFTVGEKFNDNDDGGDSWVNQNISGSYDPITKIYTEITEKEELQDNTDCGSNNCSVDRETKRVAFYYELNAKDTDRYVDFTGTWKTTEYCDNGEIAVSTMEFGADKVITSGSECGGNPTSPEDMGTTESTYADLGAMDFWWFGQINRESKATLTELNTVVRFCDQNNYVAGNACNANDEFFVKWEYQPAGTNWDEGLLIRRKMDNRGSTDGRVSIMQKVN
ncbi:hypothetical protein F0231_17705 [Vibrio sp. RE86]|uniref:hypothetical protein n=1 Tax=Vibrio sp. RE86 TaxID=2607605 RepID=UPI00149339B3|nr:hypothetical protein [Vibrio sp. RE86]NOH81577.1 hypothetical protein [Vibrio sp. RE86]